LHARLLRATLCEIERGLFHVSYRADTAKSGLHELPIYQVGTCASDARQRVEERARGCGFELVVWDYATLVPALLPASGAGEAPAADCVSADR
jgi:hypothetical protein